MPLTIEKRQEGRTLLVHATGKLTKEDYEQFTPEVERLIDLHGKIRVLFEMRDFHGWEASALWKDVKFDLKHFNDVERLAMVGEKRWQEGMTHFCRPFTTAKVKYFEVGETDEALAWLTNNE